MSIFKSKHVRIAMVLAPVLGVVSFYVTRELGTETPHAAVEGQSYQLAEKPNCRRSGGMCSLKNGDFELELNTREIGAGRLLMQLQSVFPLGGVKVALVNDEAGDGQPVELSPVGTDGLEWSLEIARPDPERDRMRLVASANRSLYFGDIAMKFTLDESEMP